MNQDCSHAEVVSVERDTEREILLPFNALYASALAHSDVKNGGFNLDDAGLSLSLPEMVTSSIGLTPSGKLVALSRSGEDHFRILLEANDTSEASYWATIFGGALPNLVMEFVIVTINDEVSISPYDEWLVWPWQISPEERMAALKEAVQRQERFGEDVNAFELTRLSVTDGPRSLLFDAVAKHLGLLGQFPFE